MPLGNDDHASRRPLPRQLDMSIDSTSLAQDGDYRRTSTCFRRANGFNYDNMSEPPSHLHRSSEDKYRHRWDSTREEARYPYEMRSRNVQPSECDVNTSSGDRNTKDETFFSKEKGNKHDSGRNSDSTYRSDKESCHDNQREIDVFSHGGRSSRSARWERQDEPSRVDHSNYVNGGPTSERRETNSTKSSAFPTPRNSAISRTQFEPVRAISHSTPDNNKSDFIREAEWPSAARLTNSHNNDKLSRSALELETLTLASSSGNQDEPSSPTNSETSNTPSDSDCDSLAHRMLDRYPKPTIPSPVAYDRSSTTPRTTSPCSPVSVNTSSALKSSSAIPAEPLHDPQRMDHSSTQNLREELYAFRKQMREVFLRVEDMVDVHRSLFKSDPSTGSPVFNGELQQEAEELANAAFKHLAELRKHFACLANDFHRPEQLPNEWSDQERRAWSETKPSSVPPVHSYLSNSSSQASNDGDISFEGSNLSACGVNKLPKRFSTVSDNNDASSSRQYSSGSRESRNASLVDSNSDGDQHSIVPESTSSSQLPFRRHNKSSNDFITAGDVGARSGTRGRSFSVDKDANSLSSQCSNVSEPDTHSIFKDFDKRMDEIRSSLNAIASGQKPQCDARVAAMSKRVTQREGARPPIRAMMDAARTRSTLREASQIIKSSDDQKNESDRSRSIRIGGREEELRRLLQELSRVNASDD